MFKNYWKIVPEDEPALLDEYGDIELDIDYYDIQGRIKLSYLQDDKALEMCFGSIAYWLTYGPSNYILNFIGKERLIRIFENTNNKRVKDLRVLFYKFLDEEPVYDSSNYFSRWVFIEKYGINEIASKKDFDIIMKHFGSIQGFYVKLYHIFDEYKKFSPRELIEISKTSCNLENFQFKEVLFDYIKDEIKEEDFFDNNFNSNLLYKISNIESAEYEIKELKRASQYVNIFNTAKNNTTELFCKNNVLKDNHLIDLVKEDFRNFRTFTFDKVSENVKEACLDEICDFLL